MSIAPPFATNAHLDNQPSVSLLVSSCDKYSDLWPPFFALFWRHWPDCPFPVYLESNLKEFDHPRVTTLRLGEDTRWGAMTRRALQLITSTDILLFLDDYLLVGPVDTTTVLAHVQMYRDLNGNYLRLRPNPPPNLPVPGLPSIGEIGPGEKYRVSLEAALWKKSALQALVCDDYSAWDMEREGTRRAARLGGFYSAKHEVIPRHNGVEKGEWMRYNVPILREAGLTLDASRPVMSRRDHAFMVLRDRVRLPFRERVRFWRIVHTTGRGLRRLLRSASAEEPGGECPDGVPELAEPPLKGESSTSP